MAIFTTLRRSFLCDPCVRIQRQMLANQLQKVYVDDYKDGVYMAYGDDDAIVVQVEEEEHGGVIDAMDAVYDMKCVALILPAWLASEQWDNDRDLVVRDMEYEGACCERLHCPLAMGKQKLS